MIQHAGPKLAALALAMALGFSGNAYSEPVGTINVRDHGATGDGKTDDTAAIQKAVNAASNARKGTPVTRGHSKGPQIITQPVVVIPSGIYRISDTILLSGSEMVLRGEGNPILHMTDDTKDILAASHAWRMRIERITFQNGAIQLRLHNQNIDTGQIVIEHCRFYNAVAKAIELKLRSTIVYVQHCIFIQCEQVLTTTTDMVTMRSSWITSSTTMAKDQAVIENHGEQLLFEDMTLVPQSFRPGQRWIDNHGLRVICRTTRFGSEGGGFTPVYNFAKSRSRGHPSSIVMENNWIAANASYTANCAVYCKEVPNMIVVRNNDLLGSKPVIVDPAINLETYFRGLDATLLHFEADGNVGARSGDFPEGLREPVYLPSEEQGMSDEEAMRRLAEAKKQVQSLLKEEATGLALWNNAHKQKSGAGEFVQIDPVQHGWNLDEVMDATTFPNATHLALAPLESDILIMRRTDSFRTWPHVTFGPIEIDLDTYPWLTWKLKDLGDEKHQGHAVKVIDVDTGSMVTLPERHHPPYYHYQGGDVKKLLGVAGKRKLLVRFYYLGNRFVAKTYFHDPAGEYLLIDFIRFEMDGQE